MTDIRELVQRAKQTALLLNEHEAAEYLRCSVGLLRKWRLYRKVEPKVIHLGRSVRYHVEDLERFVRAGGTR